ncbi:hypothetical protein [Methanoplanus endosymbiosus]|uniref:Uncharacterized protein n=1 Tax=Methanoplanus endosymbiosus TaxID=33865 RepID=A0A9E7TMX3_9EURY|nr:hypothetical protein [Methanoplanus endosymbiosus]UUX93796.1 hypothetical protein L6E24_06695 [Methanoplanus endosymbiosus]
MMKKAGLNGVQCLEVKKGVTFGAVEESFRSASLLSVTEPLAYEKDGLCECGDSEILEIRSPDELSTMGDMLTVAGIEGRDAVTLRLHFNKASKYVKSGNIRGFEAEAELFYLEFDHLYNDETECIFHCY